MAHNAIKMKLPILVLLSGHRNMNLKKSSSSYPASESVHFQGIVSRVDGSEHDVFEEKQFCR